MNTETVYQNPELDNPNPLVPPETTNTLKGINKYLPQDPKMRLLVILGAIVFFLLLISIIVTSIRKSDPRMVRGPEPTPVNTPVPKGPDNTGYSSIPDNYKAKFDIIDQKNQTDIDFNPPRITDDVGR